jgi:2',3'-cyclic-nucleotide 2'-phosphodiesterase (5'-nucleotidase family)
MISVTIDWQPMATAPKDGRTIHLRILHANYHHARTDEDRARWEQHVEAHWIDHNGGGWTYHGMMGQPVGWR